MRLSLWQLFYIGNQVSYPLSVIYMKCEPIRPSFVLFSLIYSAFARYPSGTVVHYFCAKDNSSVDTWSLMGRAMQTKASNELCKDWRDFVPEDDL